MVHFLFTIVFTREDALSALFFNIAFVTRQYEGPRKLWFAVEWNISPYGLC
jgi:hypothetical protein